ncbi:MULTISPECIES: hypothetical protein [Pseudomonas]|uniref:hypothetical protein n=1 Tax=Pseudomonas TaxID=286 RepID=UPI001F436154|nr:MULTISPECIES: hypothetical protein [Pseudomonas]MDI3251825.1 hypothetical protein [Pseudomonas sp. AL10]MDI3267745.1 hypothetical protein [Pseudomonas sp. AL15]
MSKLTEWQCINSLLSDWHSIAFIGYQFAARNAALPVTEYIALQCGQLHCND